LNNLPILDFNGALLVQKITKNIDLTSTFCQKQVTKPRLIAPFPQIVIYFLQ
jgi:hypothetical protein